jgi:hypothetical protein
MDIILNLDEESQKDLIDIIHTALLRYDEPYRLAAFLEKHQEAVPEFKNIAISLKAGIQEYNDHFLGGEKEEPKKGLNHETRVRYAVINTLIDIK